MSAQTVDNESIAKQIYKAVTQSNVWDLRKLFRTIGDEKKNRFLNEYWILDGEHRGYTFLHLSVYSDVSISQFILSSGAHPNQFNLDDNTPLHLAALHNRGIIMRILIKFGADPSIKNINGKTPQEMSKHSNRAQQTAVLIQKCLAETEVLNKLKNLPFQDPDDQHLKEVVSALSDDSIIDDVLDFIVTKLSDEHFEADGGNTDGTNSESNEQTVPPLNLDKVSTKGENLESGINRHEFVNKWTAKFSDENISTFAQLSLPAFEDWPILVSVPAAVVYGLERVLEAKNNALMEEIGCFSAASKVMDVCTVANHWLKNKFDDRLKEYEAILGESGCFTLSNLQTMTSRKWRMLKIDVIFSDTIRKIINLYNANCETTLRADARRKRKNTRKKQPSSSLISGNSTISCVAVDDAMVHVAFMDGMIRAFEFEIFDSFHHFKLIDIDEEVHVPLYMKFLNETNHKELITADSKGNVCCWFLHSSHPNKRAKCVRKWKTHSSTISGFAIPKRSDLVFTTGYDGYLRVRNLGFNGKIIHSMRISNQALTSLTLLNQNCAMIGTENGAIMEVDIKRQSISSVYNLEEESPVRALCIDSEHNHCYFSFGAHSIGVIDIENKGEWRLLGLFTEGLEHHQGAVNHLSLRGDYLWSSSEDNSVRIWDLTFLRENLENANKKKGKQTSSMPNSMQIADTHKLSLNPHPSPSDEEIILLEVWSSLTLNGKWNNGIQRVDFNEKSGLMIATAYQQELIVYDLERIDNLLQQKQPMIQERRKQLNDHEQELQQLLENGAQPKKEANGGKKKGKKKK